MRIIHPILIGHFESYSDKSKRGFSPKAVSIFNPTKDGDDDNGASSVAQPNDPPPSRHAIYSVDIQPNMRHHEKSSHDGYTRLATCGGGSKIDPLMTSPIENPLPTTSYNHCNNKLSSYTHCNHTSSSSSSLSQTLALSYGTSTCSCTSPPPPIAVAVASMTLC
jgi:hypothetical protein